MRMTHIFGDGLGHEETSRPGRIAHTFLSHFAFALAQLVQAIGVSLLRSMSQNAGDEITGEKELAYQLMRIYGHMDYLKDELDGLGNRRSGGDTSQRDEEDAEDKAKEMSKSVRQRSGRLI